MKLTQEIANLIYDLECEIGDCCYNPKSYDGRTGVYGKQFRYPLSIKALPEEATYYKDGIEKTSYRISNRDPEYVETMYYAFGANRLRIGDGIVNLLKELERRYKIDFNELEANYLLQYPNNLEYARNLLEKARVQWKNIETGVVSRVFYSAEDNCIHFDVNFDHGSPSEFDYPEDLLKENITIIE